MTGPAAGGGGDDGDQVDVIQIDLPEGTQQQNRFREVINSLTRQLELVGLGATIRAFMTPRSAVNGASGGSVNGNGDCNGAGS